MINFQVSADYEAFDHKPSSKLQYKSQKDKFGNPRSEVSVIGARLGSSIKQVTIPKLASLISQGKTWSPYIFRECPDWKRRRRLEGLFESCQVFALDFDDGTTHEEIMLRAQDLNLTPNLIHTSFSSNPDHLKYRVVFVSNSVVTDFEKAKQYSTALAILFKSDKACVDAARLYFGSTADSIKYENPTTTCSVEILDHLSKISSADKLVLKTKKCERKEIEWGDSETQKQIFSALPRKKLNLVKSKIMTMLFVIQNYSGDTGESRYNILWKHTSKIARMPEVTGAACYEWVIKALSLNPFYADWDYDASQVVSSAIEWSFNHADEPM